jgi:hypothetical protein
MIIPDSNLEYFIHYRFFITCIHDNFVDELRSVILLLTDV